MNAEVFVIVYLVDGRREYGERFRSQREADAALRAYVDGAWVERLVRS